MFNNNDLYPTPPEVIQTMVQGESLANKTIWEPSAGLGHIVDFCAGAGASVIACEQDKNLQKILHTKCKIIAEDCLTVTSDQISHIDFIIMNPPFSADEKHINYAFEIAPAGCKIIALCNSGTIENLYTNGRKQLKSLIDSYGTSQDLGQCFKTSERQTAVNVSLIRLQKPGASYKSEFEGFFMDEEPQEQGENGLMSYNVVRDLVNRYVAAVKLYDNHLNTGVKMNNLLAGFYGEQLTFTCTEKGQIKLRNEFKKDLQKSGWHFILNKMNLQKYATRGLKEEINKFVEQQTQIPFTMKNIYHMLDMVVQTAGQRMDKAILEAFDKVTSFHDDNKQGLPGYKTNSHYMLTKRFIVPNMTYQDNFDKEYYPNVIHNFRWHDETMDDMVKALCFVTGDNYDNHQPLRWLKDKPYGQWFDWSFFKIKAFKVGTVHFEFQNEEIWAKFNQRIAKLKGYPLFEGKAQTKYQERQTGRAYQKKANPAHAYKPTVLFEI